MKVNYVNIDYNKLVKEVTGGTKNRQITNNIVKKEVESKIDDSRKYMIGLIDQHPVSKEISRGPSAISTSGTLRDLRKSGKRGGGNLFSFIGFKQGTNPISDIKKLIRAPLNSKVTNIGLGKFRINTEMPDLDTIFNKTPFPWLKGLSWVEGIERGITGLGEFIFGNFSGQGSRSGRGLQLKKTIRAATFTPIIYMSFFYKEFYKKLNRK